MKDFVYSFMESRGQRETKLAPTTDSCRTLWIAVIERAFFDARWNPDNSKKTSRSHGMSRAQLLNARGDALRWFRGNTEDFRTVCEYAKLDPEHVKQLAARKLGEDVIWDNLFHVVRKKT